MQGSPAVLKKIPPISTATCFLRHTLPLLNTRHQKAPLPVEPHFGLSWSPPRDTPVDKRRLNLRKHARIGGQNQRVDSLARKNGKLMVDELMNDLREMFNLA